MRFQFETLNKKTNNGGVTRKYLPYVFTEQGIAMLAGVLKSEIAVKVSISIIKVSVEMKKFINSNGQIFERLTKIEYKLLEHDKNLTFYLMNYKKKIVLNKRYFLKDKYGTATA